MRLSRLVAFAAALSVHSLAAHAGTTGGAPAPAQAASRPAALVERIAVVVNGEPILASDVERRAHDISQQSSGLTVKEQVEAKAKARSQALDSLIDEALVLSAARDLGIAVGESEVQQAMEQIRQQNHLDQAGLDQALAEQGYSLAEYRDQLRTQLVLIKLNQRIVAGLTLVKEEDVRAVFDDAKQHGATGTYADAHDAIYRQLYEREVTNLMQHWLADERQRAYIEQREAP